MGASPQKQAFLMEKEDPLYVKSVMKTIRHIFENCMKYTSLLDKYNISQDVTEP